MDSMTKHMNKLVVQMKRTTLRIYITVFAVVCLQACTPYQGLKPPQTTNQWKVKPIPEHPQWEGGNAQKGLEFLVDGDYIGTGIPYEFFVKKFKTKDTVFERTGAGALMAYDNNAFLADNGIRVVSGNCFTCHASQLGDEIVPGLGKSPSDFTDNKNMPVRMLSFFTKLKYGKKSKEWEAFEGYRQYISVIPDYIKTHQVGVNPAFRLEEACVMHRNPEDLTYRKKPNFKMAKYTLASDVPPLWNVKKKNGLYYNGMGRGDFTKLLMQAAVLGVKDSTAARKSQERFQDVLAWMRELQPPKYPKPIDSRLVLSGKKLFEAHCSKCHGKYGKDWEYPNKVVSLSLVKTDPYYANYFDYQQGLVNWYNQSWFAKSSPKSLLAPSRGYIAPPLDGIWATAPYLHNGSVPDLMSLLNSPDRPKYWKRDESNALSSYDFEKMGWKYEVKKSGNSKKVYDTTLPGYSNVGHTFGDKLKRGERKAVIEYLKTL